jgi:polysaccharide export outer membrane protein
MKMKYLSRLSAGLIFSGLCIALFSGCTSVVPYETLPTASYESSEIDYIIAPSDTLAVFVWNNPDLSVVVPVRPDGKITTPLVEDVKASGKTPTELAREIEEKLALFVKAPEVSVTVTQFVGRYNEQIRVVGEAANPQSLPYREAMTVLDVVIAVGGLTPFASGNKASLVRNVEGETRTFRVRLDDLINKGDISANVDILPGDVLIIPEVSWF